MKNYLKKHCIILIVFITLAGVISLTQYFVNLFNKSYISDKCYIAFVIPLSESIIFDKLAMIESFRKTFNSEIICCESNTANDRKNEINEYTVAAGSNSDRITIAQKALTSDYLDLILSSGAFDLEEKEINLLRSHKGYILLEGRFGNHNKIEEATFTVRILSILLKNNNSLGAFNISANMYRPKRLLKDVQFDQPFDAYRLYRFYVLVHHVAEEKRIWIHTHGMEQFGVPDIQLFYPANDNADSLYQEVIDNTAAYLIDNGPIVDPGETVDIDGRGAIYRAKSVSRDDNHPYGAYGAIELEKCH